MLRTPRLASAVVLALSVLAMLEVRAGEDVLTRWLQANAAVTTLRVEFTQTRRLNGLKVPIRDEGVLWLDYPGKRFRWQDGEPPKTIVTKVGEEVLIVRPQEKKYERRSADGGGVTTLAALARGMPRSMAEFHRQYRLLEVKERRDGHRIMVQPLDRAARGVSVFTFVVAAEAARLQGIDIAFKDGSTQQIEFTRVVRKVPLGAELFDLDLAGFEATKF